MNSRLALAAHTEPASLRLIEIAMHDARFSLARMTTGVELLDRVVADHPDLVLLGDRLGDLDVTDALRRLRALSGVPAIVLTRERSIRARVVALEFGADDCLEEPFNPAELAARASAVARRGAWRRPTAAVLHACNTEIDLERRTVRVNGQIVVVTRTEWALLQALAERPGAVLTAPELLSKVWGPAFRDDLAYLRVWVSRLRTKLDPGCGEGECGFGDSVIRTFPGVGYMLVAQPEPSADVPPTPARVPFTPLVTRAANAATASARQTVLSRG